MQPPAVLHHSRRTVVMTTQVAHPLVANKTFPEPYTRQITREHCCGERIFPAGIIGQPIVGDSHDIADWLRGIRPRHFAPRSAAPRARSTRENLGDDPDGISERPGVEVSSRLPLRSDPEPAVAKYQYQLPLHRQAPHSYSFTSHSSLQEFTTVLSPVTGSTWTQDLHTYSQLSVRQVSDS